MDERVRRVVLACSGAPESAAAVRRLIDRHQAEVVAMTIDVGQGRRVEQARDLALAAGAVRAHVLDLVDVFATGYLLPAFQAGATRADDSLLIDVLARPLVAAQLVEIAAMEGADAVAHTAAPLQERVPIERLIRALAPDVRILSARTGPPRTAAGPAAAGTPAGVAAPETNLWGHVVETHGSPAVPAGAPAVLAREPVDTPADPALVDIRFSRGVPVSVSGIEMSLPELLDALSTIAGAHGVGRTSTARPLAGSAGLGSVRIDAPAASVLHAAQSALEAAVLPPELARTRGQLAILYAGLVRDGGWFDALRGALDAFTSSVQSAVNGTVKLRLLRGALRIAGVEREATEAVAPGARS